MNNNCTLTLELFRNDMGRIIAAINVVMYSNPEGSITFKSWHQLRTEVIRQLMAQDQGV